MPTDEPSIWDILEFQAQEHKRLEKKFGFVATGNMEARDGSRFSWGVRRDDSVLYVSTDYTITFNPFDRKAWETLTWLDPPWPWADNGREIVYPKEGEGDG